MSAPTAHIFAFSPPVVNGQVISVLANFGSSSAHLAGSTAVMRALATQILAGTGGCGIIAAHVEDTSDSAPKRTSVPTTPERIAQYNRVRELVEVDGFSWERAGHKVGVPGPSAYMFFKHRERMAARKAKS